LGARNPTAKVRFYLFDGVERKRFSLLGKSAHVDSDCDSESMENGISPTPSSCVCVYVCRVCMLSFVRVCMCVCV